MEYQEVDRTVYRYNRYTAALDKLLLKGKKRNELKPLVKRIKEHYGKLTVVKAAEKAAKKEEAIKEQEEAAITANHGKKEAEKAAKLAKKEAAKKLLESRKEKAAKEAAEKAAARVSLGKTNVTTLWNRLTACLTEEEDPEAFGLASQSRLSLYNHAVSLALPLQRDTFMSTVELGKILHTIHLIHDFDDKALKGFLKEFTVYRLEWATANQYIGRFKLWRSLPDRRKAVVGLFSSGAVDFFVRRRDIFGSCINSLVERLEKAYALDENGLPAKEPEAIRKAIKSAANEVWRKHEPKETDKSKKPKDKEANKLTGPFKSFYEALGKTASGKYGEQLASLLTELALVGERLAELKTAHDKKKKALWSEEDHREILAARALVDQQLFSNVIDSYSITFGYKKTAAKR